MPLLLREERNEEDYLGLERWCLKEGLESLEESLIDLGKFIVSNAF